jgi:hypothetical protein
MLTDSQIAALRAEAETNAEFRTLVRGANGVPADDTAAAAMASTLLPAQVTEGSRYTELGIIAAFADPAAGETLLQTLATVAASGPEHAVLARMLKWLAPGMPGLDFGNAALRGAINAYYGAGVLNNTQRDTLLALGERAVVVSPADIARVR